MKLSKPDFPHIKWSLFIFMFVLCAGGAGIIASQNFIAQAQRDQSDAQRLLNEARSKLATAKVDNENMQTYALEYNALFDRNIIGNEQRLDWVEGLEKIRKRTPGFMGLKYAISPQNPFSPHLDSGNFDLNLSGMTLQFELLHEEQLTAFFDAMRADIKGWFILDHCSLERIAAPEENDSHAAVPRLKAECGGGWLTLINRKTK